MGTEIISGVYFLPMDPIETTGGKVLHILKGLDENMKEFGECYFSIAYNNSPKAWKKHSLMTCNIFVPHGKVKFVFFDDRPSSKDFNKLEEFSLSKSNYGRLIIEPGVWFGFAGIGEDGGEAVILNVTSLLHDPAESIRVEPHEFTVIPYKWEFDQ